LRREPVLRRAAIVHRDNNGIDLTAESLAHGVIPVRVRRVESEAAAVEENDDGNNSVTGGGSGCEDTKPEVSVGVNCDVFSRNAFNGFGFGSGLIIEELLETTINGAVRATREIRYGRGKE